MALDVSTYTPLLKEYYTSQRIEHMVYKDNPLLAMVPKMENFGGIALPIPIIHGHNQRRSHDFATAKANTSTTKSKRFLLERTEDYAFASISNQVMKASRDDVGAFLEAATTEIDGAIHTATRSLAISLFRSGSGSIGQVANTSFATADLQLTVVDDVTNFEVDQILQFDSVDGGGTPHAGTLTITAINRDTGVITLSANLSTISGIATNDFIFTSGDYDGKISGLAGWLPSTAPTSGDNFFGVDRSTDVTRLAGLRIDASGQPLEEALVTALNKVSREGGRPDVIFMSYEKFTELEHSLGSKRDYANIDINANIGFRGLRIYGPKGEVKVIADQNCPSDKAYILQMDTWKLYSLDKAPHIVESDGLKMLRETNADAVEVRIACYAQLGCTAPGYNAVVTF